MLNDISTQCQICSVTISIVELIHDKPLVISITYLLDTMAYKEEPENNKQEGKMRFDRQVREMHTQNITLLQNLNHK